MTRFSRMKTVRISRALADRWATFHRRSPAWKNLDELVEQLLRLHFDESDAMHRSIAEQEKK